ncbi:hypothetical protein GCM10009075_37820 [Sphingomonas trueperi]
MSRARVQRGSFNAGELSPRLLGRTDAAAYAAGCVKMLGWMPLLQGPAAAMPGTVFVAQAAGPFRCLPFEYDVLQSYAIEASAGRFRFYTGDGRIETAPGVPYEIATPWNYAQVEGLDFHQSLDVLYLVHPSTPPMELRRLTATTFSLVTLDLQNGPFETGNADELQVVSASGDTGSVTLTAGDTGAPITGFFQPGDVGGLFELEAGDYASVPAWEPGITVAAGEDRSSDGKVYTAATSGRTGTVQPIHTEGLAYDGMASGTDINSNAAGGVQWRYKHDRFGMLRITAVAGDGASATATVLRRLPTDFAIPTWRWAFGKYSNRRGWPEAVTIWNERLVFAKGDELDGTAVGGYGAGTADFARRDDAGDFQRDLAFSTRLPNPNRIRWLAADRKLLIGTAKAEHIAEQLLVQSGTPGPPVIEIDTQSTYGSAATRPVMADGRVLFIQRAGRKVHELGYAVTTDRYEAPDMTRLAEHLGQAGFVELAWLQEPERQIWAVQGDGALAAMTYSPSQQVFGWARRELGGAMKARSIASIVAPEGTRDRMWIAAETPAGGWWMLRMMPLRDTGEAVQLSYLVDAGLSYLGVMGGPPISNGSGLAHLAGQTCSVLADGRAHRDIVIGPGGEWAIDFPASAIHIGLAYPAELSLLPPEFTTAGGTAQGQIKKILKTTLQLFESGGLEVEVQSLRARTVNTRRVTVPFDQATPLFTGFLPIDTGGDFDREGLITIRRTQPLPSLLLALVADYELQ